jgi:hypothetical protein
MYCYWRGQASGVDQGGEMTATKTQTGVLTDEHEDVVDGMPVLVEDEDLGGRVYQVWELPPNTTVYVETAPGELPEIAQRAIEAGFRVERA